MDKTIGGEFDKGLADLNGLAEKYAVTAERWWQPRTTIMSEATAEGPDPPPQRTWKLPTDGEAQGGA